ncbi:MAG: hypothetical protein NZ108_06815, partial [Bacteroidia bacterium]|nr:hypothetical protein [Bacteroidia bacterium]
CCGWSRPVYTTVTVRREVDPGQIASNQIICHGAVPVPLTNVTSASGGNGVISYQWQQSSDGINYTDIPGANNQNYAPGSLTQTTWFRRVVTSGPCTGTLANTSLGIQITVQPAIQNNNISSDQTVCGTQQPAQLNGTVPVGGNNFFTYQWQTSTDGVTFTDIPAANGGTTQNYQPPVISQTTYYRRIAISGACSHTSNIVIINYLPGVLNNNISADQSICAGQIPATLTGTIPPTLSGGNNTFTYQWQISVNNGPFSDIVGAINPNYVFNSTLTQTTAYRRVVTSGGCSVPSLPVTITVNSPVLNNTISASQNICPGQMPATLTGTVPPTLTGGDGLNYSYQWESSLDNATFTPITGATSSNYVFSIAPTVTTYYRRVVTSGGCSTPSTSVEINVQTSQLPSVTLAASSSDICAGQTVNFVALPAGPGTNPQFQWFLNGTLTTGVGNTFSSSTLSNGDQIQVSMTVSGVCSGASFQSNIITMTVRPVPTVVINGPTGTVCSGDPITFTATTNPTNATINWSVNGTFTGVTGTTFTSTTLNNGDIVSAIAISQGCTSAVSNPVTVNNISPTPAVFINSSATSICQGGSVTFTATPVNAGFSPSYQWQVNSGAGFGDIPGATASQYTTSSVNNNDVFRCIITSSSGCTGPNSISNAIQIVVNPLPSATISASTSTICQGTPVTFTVTNIVNGGTIPTYQWFVNGNA